MSTLDPSLVNDVRALLATFVRDDVRQLATKLGPGVELRISRDLPAPSGTAVRAPHVGTLIERKPEGTSVTTGETIAVLDLLGERIEVPASSAGVVAEAATEPGTLVQYGEPLAWLEDADAG